MVPGTQIVGAGDTVGGVGTNTVGTDVGAGVAQVALLNSPWVLLFDALVMFGVGGAAVMFGVGGGIGVGGAVMFGVGAGVGYCLKK